MHYKANPAPIDTSDFLRISLVYTNTLGGSEEYAYKTKPVAIEKLDDGFASSVGTQGADAPPYHKKVT